MNRIIEKQTTAQVISKVKNNVLNYRNCSNHDMTVYDYIDIESVQLEISFEIIEIIDEIAIEKILRKTSDYIRFKNGIDNINNYVSIINKTSNHRMKKEAKVNIKEIVRCDIIQLLESSIEILLTKKPYYKK